MKFQLTMLAFALTLTGCADRAAHERLGIEDASVLQTGVGATQDEAAGAANAAWVDAYATIADSRAAVTSLQARLDRIPVDKNEYFRAKAQCWLSAAQQAQHAHDGWGFVEEAIGQAASLTIGLERGVAMSAANPALRTVSTVRPDLWKIVGTIKADPLLAQCQEAQAPLACAEVELMQTGHDAWLRSFSKAEQRLPEIKAKLIRSAQITLQCQQAAASATAAPAITSSRESPQTLTLRADSLFRFNSAAISSAGKRQLDALAISVKRTSTVPTLKIVGYADRIGTPAYNQRLSLSRAQAVARYLRTRGVTWPIDAEGRGSASPLVACAQTQRDALVRCLAPNRRVEIERGVARS
ncbi:OmpA family protein [Paraburkholderia sp. D15]|uniref:OmpA family protein n=1 Tax=Paraburkholderia sp. D15 TaxID=2880218 RepID=UPI002479AAC3|nr:OmpA family protein [Paraburkholderia sp. D15]WGS54608.1 OmpA family protein [Paraburkholderia sp. D15]